MAEGFRAAATPGINTATTGTAAATIPPSVVTGDFLLAVFGCTTSTGTASLSGGPGGWTQIDFQCPATGVVAMWSLWWKTAGATDANTTITATASSATGTASLQVVAYAGCDVYNPVLIFSSVLESSTLSSFVTPTVSTTIDGAMVINVAMLKVANCTWSIPGSYVQRSVAVAPAAAAVPGGVIFDDNHNNDVNSVTSGTNYGGQTATCSLSNGHGYVASIALLPSTIACLPASDTSNPGNWVPTPSGSLWSAIDDYPVTLSTYITSPAVPSAAQYTATLGTCPSPGINTGFAVGIEAAYVSASSGTVVVTLANGGTTVQSWTVTLSSTATMYYLPLTQTQAAGIQGSSSLTVELSATAS